MVEGILSKIKFICDFMCVLSISIITNFLFFFLLLVSKMKGSIYARNKCLMKWVHWCNIFSSVCQYLFMLWLLSKFLWKVFFNFQGSFFCIFNMQNWSEFRKAKYVSVWLVLSHASAAVAGRGGLPRAGARCHAATAPWEPWSGCRCCTLLLQGRQNSSVCPALPLVNRVADGWKRRISLRRLFEGFK